MTAETSNGGILRYADLPFSACNDRSDGPLGTFFCEKARGHAGPHGAGQMEPVYSVEWPVGSEGEG